MCKPAEISANGCESHRRYYGCSKAVAGESLVHRALLSWVNWQEENGATVSGCHCRTICPRRSARVRLPPARDTKSSRPARLIVGRMSFVHLAMRLLTPLCRATGCWARRRSWHRRSLARRALRGLKCNFTQPAWNCFDLRPRIQPAPASRRRYWAAITGGEDLHSRRKLLR